VVGYLWGTFANDPAVGMDHGNRMNSGTFGERICVVTPTAMIVICRVHRDEPLQVNLVAD